MNKFVKDWSKNTKKANPWLIIAQQKKSKEKLIRENISLKKTIDELKKELAWEKTRRVK